MTMIDYAKIPEFAAAIERIKAIEATGDSMAKWFLYEVGKPLQLDVTISDPEVARVILGSSFGDDNLMPGMKITNIRFGDLERKDVLLVWLKEQVKILEEQQK